MEVNWELFLEALKEEVLILQQCLLLKHLKYLSCKSICVVSSVVKIDF